MDCLGTEPTRYLLRTQGFGKLNHLGFKQIFRKYPYNPNSSAKLGIFFGKLPVKLCQTVSKLA